MTAADREGGVPSPVTWSVEGRVLVVTIDNPPVNALGHAVREGLVAAAERLDADAALDAMVLRSAGAIFIGGADIREFAGPRRDPMLNAVCDRLEACGKPIVAAVQGAALGGGFEVALASHYRVAAPAAVVAFPEVLLGLLPGAGGTQRASRLCGAATALDLMLSGRRMPAADAVVAGLIDVLADDVLAAAMGWARQLVRDGAGPRRASEGRALHDAPVQHAAIAARHADVEREPIYRIARERILRCVTAAVDLPYAQAAAIESQAFLECLGSAERETLVQRFFAERAARKAARDATG